jgi:mRNA-degrading endonuclease toxin of MazEF toxin-antitoxin module
VQVGGKAAEVAADQIRTVGKHRLGRKLGILSDEEAEALRELLGEMYAS